MAPRIGTVLLNLGTPDTPTEGDIRLYLKEFLSDPRVVNLPRWLWLPILHGIILNVRPAKLVHRYETIWGRYDSPLRLIMAALADRTEGLLTDIPVRSAMTYGKPSVRTVVAGLRKEGIDRFLFIPAFPQYAGATIGACEDQLSALFENPEHYQCLDGYHDHPGYISALAKLIGRYSYFWDDSTILLFSFHGIPESEVKKGDPYADQCERTAQLTAQHLGLSAHQWRISYQSRFGPAPWLTPYTDELLKSLPDQGITRVLVVCPGFAAECLETLEEIKLLNRDLFLSAGGTSLKYVRALNATFEHAALMQSLIGEQLTTTHWMANA